MLVKWASSQRECALIGDHVGSPSSFLRTMWTKQKAGNQAREPIEPSLLVCTTVDQEQDSVLKGLLSQWSVQD